MSLLWDGVILWVLGKIAKIKILETIGYYAMIIGAGLMVIGWLGISLPFSLPF